MQVGSWILQWPIKRSPIKPYEVSWDGYPPESFELRQGYILVHETRDLKQVRNLYQKQCFDVSVILQSRSHRNPTVAKACGMPVNWPLFKREFGRWGETVLRVHVDILTNSKGYVSVPHVEPDPRWDPYGHMCMVMRRDSAIGPEALEVLKTLLGEKGDAE